MPVMGVGSDAVVDVAKARPWRGGAGRAHRSKSLPP